MNWVGSFSTFAKLNHAILKNGSKLTCVDINVHVDVELINPYTSFFGKKPRHRIQETLAKVSCRCANVLEDA